MRTRWGRTVGPCTQGRRWCFPRRPGPPVPWAAQMRCKQYPWQLDCRGKSTWGFGGWRCGWPQRWSQRCPWAPRCRGRRSSRKGAAAGGGAPRSPEARTLSSGSGWTLWPSREQPQGLAPCVHRPVTENTRRWCQTLPRWPSQKAAWSWKEGWSDSFTGVRLFLNIQTQHSSESHIPFIHFSFHFALGETLSSSVSSPIPILTSLTVSHLQPEPVPRGGWAPPPARSPSSSPISVKDILLLFSCSPGFLFPPFLNLCSLHSRITSVADPAFSLTSLISTPEPQNYEPQFCLKLQASKLSIQTWTVGLCPRCVHRVVLQQHKVTHPPSQLPSHPKSWV